MFVLNLLSTFGGKIRGLGAQWNAFDAQISNVREAISVSKLKDTMLEC
jgi:hypothetical protein